MSSGPSENRFFVRREMWKCLNIPRCVRSSIIERSSVVISDLERQINDTEESEFRDSCTQKSTQSNKGSGDVNTNGSTKTSTPKVQFMDSPKSTPLPSRAENNYDAQV